MASRCSLRELRMASHEGWTAATTETLIVIEIEGRKH